MLRYSGASRGTFYLMGTFSSVIYRSINNRMVQPRLAEMSFGLMKVPITPGSASWRSIGSLV